jgi:hypothetical protein
MKNNPFNGRVVTIGVLINTTIFILLSALHFYWAFGGKIWYDEVLPTSSNGLHKFNPTIGSSLFVAAGLLFLALITAGNHGLFDKHLRRVYFRYGALIIAIIFLLRAIGDFKFIGFFKKVKWTNFGVNDTWIFSPLCSLIFLLSMFIFIFNRSEPGNNKMAIN